MDRVWLVKGEGATQGKSGKMKMIGEEGKEEEKERGGKGRHDEM